jgi:hypothetical protein
MKCPTVWKEKTKNGSFAIPNTVIPHEKNKRDPDIRLGSLRSKPYHVPASVLYTALIHTTCKTLSLSLSLFLI